MRRCISVATLSRLGLPGRFPSYVGNIDSLSLSVEAYLSGKHTHESDVADEAIVYSKLLTTLPANLTALILSAPIQTFNDWP